MRRIRRFVDALGPWGVAGIGILVFCVPFYFGTVAPVEREVAKRSAAAEASQRTRVPAQPVSAPEGAAELERFYQRFPTMNALQSEMEALYAHARASG